MPSASQVFSGACVVIVIAVLIGAWRYGGGRRSRPGGLEAGREYWGGFNGPSDGHDGGHGP